MSVILDRLSTSLTHQIGEWNPQLLRELQGKVKLRNLILVSSLSIIGQFFVYLSNISKLPVIISSNPPPPNLYCTGGYPKSFTEMSYYAHNYYQCLINSTGEIDINWQLWWLDVFMTLSFISIFALILGGVYLLVADLTTEENRGTLNFIRLSPQLPKNILIGKILGVPSLIYLFTGLALPLHLYAGFSAHISPIFLILFYITLFASCLFFYSLSLLYSLVTPNLVGFKPWLITGGVLGYLWFINLLILSYNRTSFHTPFDWLNILYPGTILIYLEQFTEFTPSIFFYDMELNNLNYWYQLIWYGQPLIKNASLGIILMLGNYSLCTYFISCFLKRRFENPSITPISKLQSYLLTVVYTVVLMGFMSPCNQESYCSPEFSNSLIVFQSMSSVYFLGLIAGLTPHRDTIKDWTRYRYQQTTTKNSCWKDLLLGKRSPSSLALAINLLINWFITIPTILIFNTENNNLNLILGMLIGQLTFLIYGVLAQLLLLNKTEKRSLITSTTILAIIILPFLYVTVLNINSTTNSLPWLLTFIPLYYLKDVELSMIVVTFLSQLTLISFMTLKFTRQLKKIEDSQVNFYS